MTRRNVFALAFALAGATACTQVLGIDDRSLRPGQPGVVDTDSGSSEAGSAASEAGIARGGNGDSGVVVGNDPPRAVFSASSIDFGMVGCGTPAPANRTLVINNAGDSELDFQAVLGPTSTFSIVGASAGPVQGQSFATLTIASAGVPAYATAGQTDQVTLEITVIVPNKDPEVTDIPITQTAAGAALEVTPAMASFGQVPMGTSSAPLAIDLQNKGNLPMTVVLGTPTDPEYSIASDAGTTLLEPNQAVSGLSAYFLPTTTASTTASVGITIGGGTPLCGVAPAAIHLEGQGTSGPVSVQPGSLDFGLVNCGSTAQARQVSVTTTAGTATWSASLGKGASSPYSLSATSGTATSISPGIVTVTPLAIPSTSPVTPDFYADTLTITTPDGPHAIALHETAEGAILSLDTTAIAFGGVNVGTIASATFNVQNNGNAPANVSFSSSNGAFVLGPQGQTLGGAGYESLTTVTFSPTSTTAYSGAATMTVPSGTVLCAPLPAALPVSGTGTVSNVSVSPSSLDFGLVHCGSTAPFKSVTIKNTASSGGASFNWTATLGKGSASPFTLDSSTGLLAANKQQTVKVTPKAIPSVSPTTSDYYADTLTITTDAANDSTPHVIALHETAQGVILALSPTQLSFGDVAVGSSASLPFSVSNTGNLPAHVTLSVGSGGLNFSVDPSTLTTVNGDTSTAGTATFHPVQPPGTKSATITASFPDTSCGAAVAPISMTGNGT